MNKRRYQEGFTLLEILLVVAAIGILAGIVILAINPGKQLGDTRNAQRKVDVNTILNAVYQQALDSNGAVDSNIPFADALPIPEICATGVLEAACNTAGLVYLGSLTTNEVYLIAMPVDPSGATTTDGTGYQIEQTANGRVHVQAAGAEQGQTIQVTR